MVPVDGGAPLPRRMTVRGGEPPCALHRPAAFEIECSLCQRDIRLLTPTCGSSHYRCRNLYPGNSAPMSTKTLRALLDGDYTQWKRVMHNCAVSELVIEPEPALLSFNVTEHLEGI